MKVGELIALLNACDQEADVLVNTGFIISADRVVKPVEVTEAKAKKGKGTTVYITVQSLYMIA